MYKVMLIDDEPWILKDLELLVDWEDMGFEIVYTSTNAENALYFIKKHKPDLIISDIKMPGIDGLEFVEIVKNKYSDIEIIFISAYSEFDFAQKAVKLGAFDYILKPTDKDKLEKVLLKVAEHLKNNKIDRENIKKYKKMELFYYLIENKISKEKFIDQLSKNKLKPTGNQYQIAIMKKNSQLNVPFDQLLPEELVNITLLSSQIGEHKLALLLNFNSSKMKMEKNIINNLFKKIVLDNNIIIGMSLAFKDPAYFRCFYRQAELMCCNDFIEDKANIYLYSSYSNNHELITGKVKNIKSKQGLISLINDIPEIVKKEKISIEGINHIYNSCIKKIEKLGNQKSKKEILDVFEIIYSYNNLDELIDDLLNKLQSINNKSNYESHPIIKKIKKDIDLKYADDLRLQKFADKYHINSCYLSQLFKDKTGKTFTKYLIEQRINKAIELFKDDLLFYEISKKVGYDDYYHFCKLFKRYKGMNPSEYKKRYIS